MMKTVLTFGVISGVISAGLMFATIPFMERIGFDNGAIVGYSGMLMSFLFVYFGVRSFRDNQQHGQITFGKAFVVGLAITAISSLFYVAAWEFTYKNLTPDFMDKYAAYAMEKAKQAGLSEADIAKRMKEMDAFKVQYDSNTLMRAAMTFAEPLPVGLLVTLVSAAVLRKKTTAET